TVIDWLIGTAFFLLFTTSYVTTHSGGVVTAAVHKHGWWYPFGRRRPCIHYLWIRMGKSRMDWRGYTLFLIPSASISFLGPRRDTRRGRTHRDAR
ncbi:hypothetical protein C8R44DRAFT_825448, partial [Mycena epipterygia]